MWTKAQLIDAAFEELALAGFVVDISAEEQQSALRRMDTMMATWEGKGIRLGYALPATPDASDVDSPSGLPDKANEAVFTNLAVRLAASFGKTLNVATMAIARDSYAALLTPLANPRKQQLPATLPMGAGNRSRGFRRTFFPPPTNDPMPVDDAGDLEYLQ